MKIPLQLVSIREVDDQIWQVSSMHYDFGYSYHESYRLKPIENAFAAKVLPMSSE